MTNKAYQLTRTFIRVYFFETDRFRDYYQTDFEPHTTVGTFIKFSVEDFCRYFLQFDAGITSGEAFALKLTDLKNQHDPLIE
jgi:hypothetical protein